MMSKSFILKEEKSIEEEELNLTLTGYNNNPEKNFFEVYCISCFKEIIWKNKLFILTPKNKQILAINKVYEKNLYFDKDFLVVIHEINFNNEYQNLKTISLEFHSKDRKNKFNFVDLNFRPDKDKVLFTDLEINNKNKFEFLTSIKTLLSEYNNNKNIYNDKEENYFKILSISDKLKYFLEFAEEQNQLNILGPFIAEQFLINSKKQNIFYSDIIKVFCLSINTKIITQFLDSYELFNYSFNENINYKKFNEILELYNNNKEILIGNNLKFFSEKKKKNEKKDEAINRYKTSLENFITFYQLIYLNSVNIERKRLTNVFSTVFTILGNKTDIVDLTKFLENKYNCFYKLIEKGKRIQLDITLNSFNFADYINFKVVYSSLIRIQEEKSYFIFDYSQIFNQLINIYNNQYDYLIDIKNLYKIEMKIFPNKELLNVISEKIHYAGLNLINNNKYDNNFLIIFIQNNEYYTNPKYYNDKENKYIKDFSILKYFNINLMNNDFFEQFNYNKIYSFFLDNSFEYLLIFAKKIKAIKYFGYFFKLLPPEKYCNNTIELIFIWLKKYINTFLLEECPNFINEIKIYVDIMIMKKQTTKIYDLLKFIKKNVGNYYIKIFIFLINNADKRYPQNIIDFLINSLLFPNEEKINEEENIAKNILPTLKEINNKIIEKIILQKISNFSISKEDFFLDDNIKFDLFEFLLNNEDYTLIKNDSYKHFIYWENTEYNCQKIADNLNSLNLNFKIIKMAFNILEEKIFKRTILVFKCLNEENYNQKSTSIINTIKNIIKKWEENQSKIENLKIFVDNFYGIEGKAYSHKLSLFNKNIFNYTLDKLNSKIINDEYLSYEKDFKKAKKAENLMKSQFFIEIYRNLKEKIYNKELFEQTINHFNNIKKLFVNDKNKIEKELKDNPEIKYLINISYKNRELLNKEIDWLINYFQIVNFQNKDLILSKINLLLQNKTLFSIISGILQFFDIYKDILNLENNNLNIKFYKNLNNYKSYLKIKENIDSNKIKEIILYIEEQFGILFKLKNKKKIFSDFFVAINQYPESLIFIKDKKSEDVSNLIEFLLESDDSYLTENDINDFIKILTFFEKILKNNEKNKSIINIISDVIEGILDNNKCGNSIFNYIEKYNYIQILLTNYLKHTEGCIKIIKNILDKSEFSILFNDKQSKYHVIGFYLNNEKNIQHENNKNNNNEEFLYLYYENLESIFQRVFVAKIPEKNKDIVNKFIELFKNIKEFINIFNDLYSKGYHEKIELKININKSEIFCNYNNKKYLINVNQYFSDIRNIISESLEKCYINNESIKLFYSKQLFFIYKNIISQQENKNKNLFKIVTNNLFKEINKSNISFVIKNDEEEIYKYNKNIANIAQYIEEQLILNNIKYENIFNNNKIISGKPLHSEMIKSKQKEKNEYIGVYFYMTEKQEIESLNIYMVLTSNLPTNSCFLYCSKSTSSEELNCFLLRSFFCKVNALFCMINTNSLNDIVKRNFYLLIKKYSKLYGENMQSCLLIIFNTKSDDIHEILLKTKNIKIFKSFPFIFSFDNNYKVSLINSSNCGIGKTHVIKEIKAKKIINKLKENYIYFPIGGKFYREDLAKRLKKLPDMSDIDHNFIIHFDISQTEEINLLNEFFFKLIILRKCEIDENAIYFDKNIEIIIEIPNDFKDYKKEIIIFSYLPSETITIKENSQINPSKELTLVSSILNMYETNDILNRNYEMKNSNLKLSSEQCHQIIMKYLNDIKIENPNYYQINIFIKVLYDQFSKFSNCPGYNPQILENNANISGMNKKEALSIRKFIINSLIQVTKLFLVSPYENLIKNQQLNQAIYQNDEEKEKSINKSLSIKIDSVSFDKIRPSLVVFNEDGNSCTIITTCSEDEIEFKNLEKLYNSQSTDYQRKKFKINNNNNNKNNNFNKLRNFRKLEENEILDNLLSFLNVSGFNEEQKKLILGSYVYTSDNFIKVVLILMRLRVKIPVIMMGETGCGKTTLIEMASKLINKGKVYIKKMNIHAGIIDEDIINFINEIKISVISEDKILLQKKEEEFESLPEVSKQAYLKNNSKEKIIENYKNEIKQRKIWIFFDEINTCNSMGLLTEIMCKNSIYGEPLDERFIFIAACNPYRISDKQNNSLNILYKSKSDKKKNLIYNVNPLPLSLLNFVFNFGSLKNEDEKSYIKSMITITINNLCEKYKDLNENEKNKVLSIEIELIEICQKYMKNNYDISIVSLREVNRFNLMLEYFMKYIKDRKNNINNSFMDDEINTFYNSKTNIQIYYSSINLSIYICYYLRLPDKQSRKELEKIINEKIYFEGGFLNIPIMEQNYIINNFEIPKGIAKNRNLKENLFILFFCVINKIPLITLGKPGRSKTLSFRILQNSMRGHSSKSSFCKQYPKIIPYKIQGSLNTTSLEIKTVFNKARDNQKRDNDKIIVVFMDEMGLAEISENNPLKILHFELEKEENKISFVGISNWFIDASKMNRVIYNVVQDPDEEDIIETAEQIAKSYEENGENYFEKYGNILINLSKAYYKFITKKQKENDQNQYFHGSRDFYSLIKSIMNDIVKNKKLLEEDEEKLLITKICDINIERNFGGLPNSVNDFKYFFQNEYIQYKYNNNNYDVKKCIYENINDDTSRYLLLITESSLSQEIINYILEEYYVNKYKEEIMTKDNSIKEDTTLEYKITDSIQLINNLKTKKENFKKYISGSKFKSDKKNIFYSNELLNKIKYYMETDIILVMSNLEIIYPSLYELFNQSYTYLEGKKFVYLANSKSLSLVNDKFKVIILVNQNLIKYQEPPFLNRFEKHIINFSYFLNENSLSLAEEIFKTLKEIVKSENKENKEINIEKIFKKHINFVKEEEIKGLAYIATKNSMNYENQENEKIIEYILKRISPCFSEELMILITKYGFRNKFTSYYNIIYNTYKDKYCNNINDYLSKLNEEISIIYTFSSFVIDIIDDEEKIKNKFYNIEFSKETTYEININIANSMKQIEKEINDFIYNEEKNKKISIKNLLILKFKEEDIDKFNDIYYLVNDYINDYKRNQVHKNLKFIIFVIYLPKGKNINYLSFLLNCPQILISNFDNKYLNFPEIIIESNEEIIKKRLVDINLIINNKIENAFRYFSFELINSETNPTQNNQQNSSYKDGLISQIQKTNYMKDVLIKCLINIIKNEENLVFKIFNKEILIKEKKNNYLFKIDFMDLLYKYLNDFIFKNLRKIIIILEKEQILNSLYFNDKIYENNIIQNYINNFINHINIEEYNSFFWNDEDLDKKITIPVLYGQMLPLCENIFKLLFNYIQMNISTKFIEKENYFLRTNIKSGNLRNEQENYLKEIQKLNSNLKLELSKYNIIIDILNSNNKDLISDLFNDCIYSFIKQNDKFKTNYREMSSLLNLLIQLRLKTRLNISLDYSSQTIEINNSFMDLINEEKKEENNDNNIYLYQFINIIIFLQSYSKEIYIILEMFLFLHKYIPSLINDIKAIIINKKIEMEDTNRNPYYSKINKLSFFYIIESMCEILKEKLSDILVNVKNDFYQSLKYFIENALKLEKRFLLFSKKIFILEIIVNIIYQSQLKNNNSFYELLNETIKVLSSNDIENINNNLNFINIAFIKFFGGNSYEYCKLMNKFLLNKYKSECNDEYREKLLEPLISNKIIFNNNIIDYSYPVIQAIFKFSNIEQNIGNLQKQNINFFYFIKDNNDIHKMINNKNNTKINEIILYRYEIVFDYYFRNIINEKKTEKKKNISIFM